MNMRHTTLRYEYRGETRRAGGRLTRTVSKAQYTHAKYCERACTLRMRRMQEENGILGASLVVFGFTKKHGIWVSGGKTFFFSGGFARR